MPEYRITMRKHQYSASVCAKSVFPIVPKLDYIIQYFMIFPMMHSKLGHKLTNVKTARINKLLINKGCRNCLLNCSTILCSFSRSFQRCSVHCGTSYRIRANAHIKCQTITSIFSKRLRKICLPNCPQARLYYSVFHDLSNDVQQIGAQAHQRQNGKY